MKAEKYIGSKIKINRGLTDEEFPDEILNIVKSIENLLKENENNTWLYGVEEKDIEILEQNIELYKVAYLSVDEYTTTSDLNNFRRKLLGPKAYSANANAFFTLEEIEEKLKENYFIAVKGVGEIQRITEINDN